MYSETVNLNTTDSIKQKYLRQYSEDVKTLDQQQEEEKSRSFYIGYRFIFVSNLFRWDYFRSRNFRKLKNSRNFCISRA